MSALPPATSWVARLRCCCLLAALLLLAAPARLRAQGLPAATTQQLDKLFQIWNSTASPGCVVGIVRHDSLLYAKGFGMANLEYGVINMPQTPFHVASVFKQFTAYAIVLLARQGKVNLDADIRTYLPWFPDLKARITCRHLLTHTSGIRDQWALLAITGTRLQDVITQQQVLKILTHQRALNSPPARSFSTPTAAIRCWPKS